MLNGLRKNNMLAVQQEAPAFSLLDQDNVTRSLAENQGKLLVLYFYPKDDTPGCTKEACVIAEMYEEFSKQTVAVFGVSKDSPASHKKFKEKYKLPFTLLSDPSGDMIEAYGAWQHKSLFGRKFMGVARISYLIGTDGRVLKVYPNVDPATHAHEILFDIRSLG
jgi:thioredoxin-dependent peroxiredoxin